RRVQRSLIEPAGRRQTERRRYGLDRSFFAARSRGIIELSQKKNNLRPATAAPQRGVQALEFAPKATIAYACHAALQREANHASAPNLRSLAVPVGQRLG